jgi:hypothetical protein
VAFALGVAVGSALGFALGFAVGLAVGLFVGFAVGTLPFLVGFAAAVGFAGSDGFAGSEGFVATGLLVVETFAARASCPILKKNTVKVTTKAVGVNFMMMR